MSKRQWKDGRMKKEYGKMAKWQNERIERWQSEKENGKMAE